MYGFYVLFVCEIYILKRKESRVPEILIEGNDFV